MASPRLGRTDWAAGRRSLFGVAVVRQTGCPGSAGVSIDKEFVPQQRHEAAEVRLEPTAQLQIPHQQQSNECCANVNLECIGRRAHKRLDLQILLEGLEQHFYLPPLAINGGDGHRVEVKVIGQEEEFPLMFFIPPDDASEKALVFAGGLLGEHDNLISADVRVRRSRPVFQLHPRRVALEPGDELDAAD